MKDIRKEGVIQTGVPVWKASGYEHTLSDLFISKTPIHHLILKLSVHSYNFFFLQYVSGSTKWKVASIFPERAFCLIKELSANTLLPACISLHPRIFPAAMSNTDNTDILLLYIKPLSLRVCNLSETQQRDLLLIYWSCLVIRIWSHPIA